jgi:hypothetical protein
VLTKDSIFEGFKASHKKRKYLLDISEDYIEIYYIDVIRDCKLDIPSRISKEDRDIIRKQKVASIQSKLQNKEEVKQNA